MTAHILERMPVGVNVVLIATDPVTGEETDRAEAHNLLTSAGKVLVARFLAGEEGTGIGYCEIGTGSTAPNVSDTALGTSTRRNAVQSPPSRAANVVTYRTFFASSDATALIREVGLFGGSAATATQGTGALLARALITFDNTAGTKDISISWAISVGA